MRLILHIGTHKTGTTAVQHFLTANRAKLADQGVLYPLSGRPPRDAIAHGQHMLAWAITRPHARALAESADGEPGPGPEGVWRALREELADSGADHAVVSSEEFDVIDGPDQFAALRSHLDGIEVGVVLYLRRQDEFLHSYYCTDVLFHREARDFEEYRTTLKTEANYERLLAPWEEAFGREALVVRTYERSGLRDGDIVADLCHEAGIDSAGLTRPAHQRQINRAYSRNVINCVLRARRAGMPEHEIASLRALFNLVYRDRPSQADYLSPPARLELLREFRASNQAVARRYLGREKLFDSLGVGDEKQWEQRYGGELADITTSIDDAKQALLRLAGSGGSSPAAPSEHEAENGVGPSEREPQIAAGRESD